MNSQDIRWMQRFQNFDRAFQLLSSALENRAINSLSQLEQEGVIQRFEYTFELAWKTIKDYLQENGVEILPDITPRSVLKTAFSAKIIDNASLWINMMLHRNLLSHCYDFSKFQEVLEEVKKSYLEAFSSLHQYFNLRILENE